eukprot:9119268-Pyramimonas_sp.AAC.1
MYIECPLSPCKQEPRGRTESRDGLSRLLTRYIRRIFEGMFGILNANTVGSPSVLENLSNKHIQETDSGNRFGGFSIPGWSTVETRWKAF